MGWKSSALMYTAIFVALVVMRMIGMAAKSDASPAAPPTAVEASVVDSLSQTEQNPYAKYALAESSAPACATGFQPVGRSCYKICPDGYHAAAAWLDRCDKDIQAIADRSALGRCPAGYVDHPIDPGKCILPAVASRMMRR